MLETVRYFLTWLLFLGVYVANPIPREGSLRVPVAVGGLAAIILLFLNLKKIRFQHLCWILAVATLCLVSLTLRAYTLPEMSIQNHVTHQMTSWVVLVYSISIGYAAYLELTQWNKDRIVRLFKILTLALLMGAALEVFVPPFKALSDAFRFTVFERGVYVANFRDVALYGAVRPKLFTSEPSHLAKYFVFFTVAWLLITTQKQKYLWFFAYVALGFFLIRSPTILIAPIIGLASLLIDRETNFHQKYLLLFILIVLLTPLAVLHVGSMLAPRLGMIAAGQDSSFIVRFLAPLHVMFDVISDYPVLGLGFGAKEIGLDYMNEAVANLTNTNKQVDRHDLGHNFVFIALIQFGLAGFTLFVFLLWRMLVMFGRGELLLVTMTALGFMQATGTPNSFRIWFILFVLCAVVRVRMRSSQSESPASAGLAPPLFSPPAGKVVSHVRRWQ